jgi:hypothetical protein
VSGNGRIDCLFFPNFGNLDAAAAVDGPQLETASTQERNKKLRLLVSKKSTDGFLYGVTKKPLHGRLFCCRAHTEKRQQIFGKKWN